MKRYHSLRFVSNFYKVCGILVGIGAVVYFLGLEAGAIALVNAVAQQGVEVTTGAYIAAMLPGVYSLIGGIIAGITLYAVGAFIMLMIDIESNTRRTAANTRREQPERERTLNGMWDDQ
jgi:hypothetical protein